MPEEKITKAACARLLWEAERAHQRTAVVSGLIAGVSVFLGFIDPLFSAVPLLGLLAYTVYVFKTQGNKLKYLEQKYIRGGFAGGGLG